MSLVRENLRLSRMLASMHLTPAPHGQPLVESTDVGPANARKELRRLSSELRAAFDPISGHDQGGREAPIDRNIQHRSFRTRNSDDHDLPSAAPQQAWSEAQLRALEQQNAAAYPERGPLHSEYRAR